MPLPSLPVSDFMSRDLLCVRETMGIGECVGLLRRKHVSGAPVVDAEGSLVGVVSMTDLVTALTGSLIRILPEPEFAVPPPGASGPAASGFQFEEGETTRVRDVMSTVPITVAEKATVQEAARVLLDRHIHRALVTRNGKLVGIISSLDLLRALLG